MKKTINIFFCVLFLFSLFICSGCEKAVKSDSFIKIGETYDNAKDFSEGFAAVKKDGKWGFIDTNGNMVIEPKYIAVWSFSEGLAAVQIQDGKWGFINTEGNEVIKPQFDAAWYFSEGLAVIKQGKYFGYINTSGEIVIEPKYTDAINFTAEITAVQKDEDKYGFIDKKGNEVTNFIYYEKTEFSDGLAEIFVKYESGFIDESGNTVIEMVLDDAKSFSENLCAFSKEGKWGYIDKSGKEVIAPAYASAEEFSEGMAVVESDRLFGYITSDGTLVIPTEYAAAYSFSESFGRVKLSSDNEKGNTNDFIFIKKDGTKAFDKTFKYAKDFSEGYAASAIAENKWGLIDKDGNTVIEFDWAEVYSVTENTVRLFDGKNYSFAKIK